MQLSNIVFEPTAKQAEFLASSADICMMAGGAGSGKSYIMLWDSLGLNDPNGHRITLPYYRALLYRKQFKQLNELIDKSKTIFPLVDPGAVYTSTNSTWTFSSGAKIQFSYFEEYEQVETLQGQQYAYIGCDELGTYEDARIMKYAMSRLRSAEGLKCYFRATSNPSRYKWLRAFFKIDNIGTSTNFTNEIVLSDGSIYKQRVQYIQAMLKDNPHISKDYEAQLLGQDADERNALLFGRWDAYDSDDGKIYQKELDLARKQNRICAVNYDPNLDVTVYFDIGRDDLTTLLYVQRLGKEIRIIDSYFNNGQDITYYMKHITDSDYKIKRIVLPHDSVHHHMEHPLSTKEIAQEYVSRFRIAVDHGKALSVEEGIANVRRMFINFWIDSNRCKRFLDDIDAYKREYNKKNEIWGKPKHDHSSHFADCLRYVCQDADHMPINADIPQPDMPMNMFGSANDVGFARFGMMNPNFF